MSMSQPPAQFGTNSIDPAHKKPATQLLREIGDAPGQNREATIIALAMQGHIPDFLQTWVPVPVKQGQINGELWVLPDFFCLGTDDDYVRVRVNPLTAEAIGEWLGGHLPTVKMVDDIYRASTQRVPAQPWGPPYDKSMLVTSRWPAQDAKIKDAMRRLGYVDGELTAGHLKNVVVGRGMEAKNGTTVGIYGWFRPNGTPIQGPNANFSTHEVTYADYSHGIRFVHRIMSVEGEPRAVVEVLKSPNLAPLISGEGPLRFATYGEARRGV